MLVYAMQQKTLFAALKKWPWILVFALIQMTIPWWLTSYAQKSIDTRSLDEAIDEHRQVCFDRAEREAALENAYLDWINSYEEVAVAC